MVTRHHGCSSPSLSLASSRQGGEAVGVAQGAGEIEGLVELGLGEGDLGVGVEDLAEGPALLPGGRASRWTMR
jgi:hypothetical protein